MPRIYLKDFAGNIGDNRTAAVLTGGMADYSGAVCRFVRCCLLDCRDGTAQEGMEAQIRKRSD